MNTMDCALDFLKHGLSLVPIAKGEKRPLCDWKKYQSQKPDEMAVRRWYAENPDAGVGAVCGAVSGGLVVLDIDPRNGGSESIKGRLLPLTPCVCTGGGGWHYYFRAQGVQKKTGLLPGVDLQGEGALAIAPPSLHGSGKRYAWSEGRKLGEIELAPMPDWIWELIRAPQRVQPLQPSIRPEKGIEKWFGVVEGGRHDAMTRLAGHWLAKGIPQDDARQLARAANSSYKPPLPDAEVDEIVRSLAKKEGTKDKSKSERPKYSGDFEGLVEIVAAQRRSAFLVRDAVGRPLLTSEHSLEDGQKIAPPPIGDLPWLLPRGDETLRCIQEADALGVEMADRELFRDLTEYHRQISELPGEEYYPLLAAFDLHTYLMESFQYSPILLLYSVPERGKTRTGKGLLYVVRRGIHVESLRDAYIIRAANDLKATLLFDARAFWKKAEQVGSDDVILLRFERGGRVPRVLFPERGPFMDTVYYSVFGPTIIATNDPLHHILETRAISLQMPDSSKTFEMEVRPENALALKERLVAFRFRHLGKALPTVEKPARGRLGDIMRPLIQMARLAAPDAERGLLELTQTFERARQSDKSEGFDAQLILAVSDLNATVAHGSLSVKEIAERFNEGKAERDHWTPQRVSKSLTALGFKKGKSTGGKAVVLYDRAMVERLKASYGLNASPSSPSAPPRQSDVSHGELGEDALGAGI